MDNKFLQSFANTNHWTEFKKYLLQYKDIIENVNDVSLQVKDATKGEMYVGKQIAGLAIESIIIDVDKHKIKSVLKKKAEDNFN